MEGTIHTTLFLFFGAVWIAIVWGWTNHTPWIERHFVKLGLLLGLLLGSQGLCAYILDTTSAILAIGLSVLFPLAVTIFLAPSLVAFRCDRPDAWRTVFINILLGFPIGWVIAWAFAFPLEVKASSSDN